MISLNGSGSDGSTEIGGGGSLPTCADIVANPLSPSTGFAAVTTSIRTAHVNHLDRDQQVFPGPERIVHGGDIGMAQAGLNLDFPQEALGLRPRVGPPGKDLDGLDSLGDDVFDFENPARAPATDQADNFVLADDPSGF